MKIIIKIIVTIFISILSYKILEFVEGDTLAVVIVLLTILFIELFINHFKSEKSSKQRINNTLIYTFFSYSLIHVIIFYQYAVSYDNSQIIIIFIISAIVLQILFNITYLNETKAKTTLNIFKFIMIAVLAKTIEIFVFCYIDDELRYNYLIPEFLEKSMHSILLILDIISIIFSFSIFSLLLHKSKLENEQKQLVFYIATPIVLMLTTCPLSVYRLIYLIIESGRVF